MKKLLIGLFIMLAMAILVCPASAAKKVKGDCATIQSGEILNATTGEVIELGYNLYGYNYQAHMFNGDFCGYDYNLNDCNPLVEHNLMMKWNDAWLSNMDCDGDDLLDRHYGYPTYQGSGAWLTNHESGLVECEDGEWRQWTYFIKIVTPGFDAISDGDYWYDSDGDVIGPVIWGQFAIIQEVSNDPSGGAHGILYKSPIRSGLGNW